MDQHPEDDSLTAALTQVTASLTARYPHIDPSHIAERVVHIADGLASRATIRDYLPVLTEHAVRDELDRLDRNAGRPTP